MATVEGVRDIKVEQQAGQSYLTVDIDSPGRLLVSALTFRTSNKSSKRRSSGDRCPRSDTIARPACSTFISRTPSTVAMIAAISLAFSVNVPKSSPNSLIAISVLTPEISSSDPLLNRLTHQHVHSWDLRQPPTHHLNQRLLIVGRGPTGRAVSMQRSDSLSFNSIGSRAISDRPIFAHVRQDFRKLAQGLLGLHFGRGWNCRARYPEGETPAVSGRLPRASG